MGLVEALQAAVEVLDDLGRSWCVVGGIAVATRVPSRFTVDVDVAVAVADDADAEGIALAFLQRGFTLVQAMEQESTGRLAAVHLQRGPQQDIDLMFAMCGIESQIVRHAERLQVLPSVWAPTAMVGHLVAMKLLSVDERRVRDGQDLVDLLTRCSTADLAMAKAAVMAMEASGAARGRDLQSDLVAWLRRIQD